MRKDVVSDQPVMLIRVNEVSALVSLSRSQVYKLIKRQEFPAPIRLGRSARWRRADVERVALEGGWREPRNEETPR
jgi:excisionase family DNA binding protein